MEQRRNVWRGNWEIPEKTCRPAASFGTIPACGSPGATPSGIEPDSPKEVFLRRRLVGGSSVTGYSELILGYSDPDLQFFDIRGGPLIGAAATTWLARPCRTENGRRIFACVFTDLPVWGAGSAGRRAVVGNIRKDGATVPEILGSPEQSILVVINLVVSWIYNNPTVRQNSSDTDLNFSPANQEHGHPEKIVAPTARQNKLLDIQQFHGNHATLVGWILSGYCKHRTYFGGGNGSTEKSCRTVGTSSSWRHCKSSMRRGTRGRKGTVMSWLACVCVRARRRLKLPHMVVVAGTPTPPPFPPALILKHPCSDLDAFGCQRRAGLGNPPFDLPRRAGESRRVHPSTAERFVCCRGESSTLHAVENPVGGHCFSAYDVANTWNTSEAHAPSRIISIVYCRFLHTFDRNFNCRVVAAVFVASCWVCRSYVIRGVLSWRRRRGRVPQARACVAKKRADPAPGEVSVGLGEEEIWGGGGRFSPEYTPSCLCRAHSGLRGLATRMCTDAKPLSLSLSLFVSFVRLLDQLTQVPGVYTNRVGESLGSPEGHLRRPRKDTFRKDLPTGSCGPGCPGKACPVPARSQTREVIIEQRRNARAGETGDVRENPPTSGIVRYGSRVPKSGIHPAGNRTPRFALSDVTRRVEHQPIRALTLASSVEDVARAMNLGFGARRQRRGIRRIAFLYFIINNLRQPEIKKGGNIHNKRFAEILIGHFIASFPQDSRWQHGLCRRRPASEHRSIVKTRISGERRTRRAESRSSIVNTALPPPPLKGADATLRARAARGISTPPGSPGPTRLEFQPTFPDPWETFIKSPCGPLFSGFYHRATFDLDVRLQPYDIIDILTRAKSKKFDSKSVNKPRIDYAHERFRPGTRDGLGVVSRRLDLSRGRSPNPAGAFQSRRYSGEECFKPFLESLLAGRFTPGKYPTVFRAMPFYSAHPAAAGSCCVTQPPARAYGATVSLRGLGRGGLLVRLPASHLGGPPVSLHYIYQLLSRRCSFFLKVNR
ncbi:hypothetical protein PR048_023232 [Dryococelus australis]|uniref:Uncharacterized protein n=1 Tax=Dryococelus australis TaxID=614101 RepID=A0ABQ9GTJ4_9NEOP|nr:hypothetical protein PR048_023232 [Dryococelus australis]